MLEHPPTVLPVIQSRTLYIYQFFHTRAQEKAHIQNAPYSNHQEICFQIPVRIVSSIE